jgi:hypothetical protein
MSQSTKVKAAIKTAVGAAKIKGTAAEAKLAAGAWRAVVDDLETTNDLRGLAVFHKCGLEACVINGEAEGREYHLAALAAAAARYE